MRRPLLLLGCLGAAATAVPSPATAASKPVLVIRGAGFGHGVGMSQYGARGLALRGSDYDDILRHYYRGTRLGAVPPDQPVRVLLQQGMAAASFSGATAVGGRRTSPRTAYRVVARGRELELQTRGGRPLFLFASPLRVSGRGPLRLAGPALNGQSGHRYRGVLDLSVSKAGGIDVVNQLELDEYVAGVIGSEMSPEWPVEALKAQAVAARTYAITTSAGGNRRRHAPAPGSFDQYPDTRSQVYGGVSSESPRTLAPTRATRGQVVTYRGKPAATYYFSTSGGLTEDAQFSFLGSPARPWLRSVADPYDRASPRHRWRITMSPAAAGRRLAGLVRGRFRGIRVIRRGRSPRVVTAEIVGTEGITPVRGSVLRARLDLPDTWAYFAVVG